MPWKRKPRFISHHRQSRKVLATTYLQHRVHVAERTAEIDHAREILRCIPFARISLQLKPGSTLLQRR